MKTTIISLLLIVSLSAFANKTESTEVATTPPVEKSEFAKIDFAEPPYWMPSFDEISDLAWTQKNYYFKNALPLLKKMDAFNKTSETDLKNWVSDRTDWEKLMTHVYTECGKPTPDKSCKKLEDVRVDAINLEGRK